MRLRWPLWLKWGWDHGLCWASVEDGDDVHACEEDPGHGYMHTCSCGFRWAA